MPRIREAKSRKEVQTMLGVTSDEDNDDGEDGSSSNSGTWSLQVLLHGTVMGGGGVMLDTSEKYSAKDL
jgi:hypothetical protein